MSKQDQIQDSIATASLADLPLTTEQDEQTKGAGGSGRVTVRGGNGDDMILCGAGIDVLIGNTGGDR
jgi:Ca2+-binding RTX toxin-like protein